MSATAPAAPSKPDYTATAIPLATVTKVEEPQATFNGSINDNCAHTTKASTTTASAKIAPEETNRQCQQGRESSGVNVPPGCKPGGVWGKVHYRGSKTGAATCAGCLLFFVPGLLMLYALFSIGQEVSL